MPPENRIKSSDRYHPYQNDVKMKVDGPVRRLTLRQGRVTNNPNRPPSPLPEERETDDTRLSQRLRQINMGKVTEGYVNYLKKVKIDDRKKHDIWTPNIYQKVGKRCFDGQIRAWRRRLHKYDVADEEHNELRKVNDEGEKELEDFEKKLEDFNLDAFRVS